MEVQGKYLDSILPDNEILYLELLQATLESVDELCSLEVTKLKNSLHFRIAPSLPKFNNMLLQEVLNLNNKFGIQLNLSKSIKTSASLEFSIEIK